LLAVGVCGRLTLTWDSPDAHIRFAVSQWRLCLAREPIAWLVSESSHWHNNTPDKYIYFTKVVICGLIFMEIELTLPSA